MGAAGLVQPASTDSLPCSTAASATGGLVSQTNDSFLSRFSLALKMANMSGSEPNNPPGQRKNKTSKDGDFLKYIFFKSMRHNRLPDRTARLSWH